jgi:hypothetical protein
MLDILMKSGELLRAAKICSFKKALEKAASNMHACTRKQLQHENTTYGTTT